MRMSCLRRMPLAQRALDHPRGVKDKRAREQIYQKFRARWRAARRAR